MGEYIRIADDEKGFTIDASPGQTYFFRIGIEQGIFKGNSTIAPEDRDRAG